MDFAGMLAALAANPNMVAQFQAFLATQSATAPDVSNATQDNRSPTMDRSSDPTDHPNERRVQSSTADKSRGRSVTVGRSSDPAGPLEEQRGRPRTPRQHSPGRADQGPELQVHSPNHRTPPPSPPHSRSPTPSEAPSRSRLKSPIPARHRQSHHSRTRSSTPRRRDKTPTPSPRHPRPTSEHRSPSINANSSREGPAHDDSHPEGGSRPATPSPPNKRQSQSCSASPSPGPSTRQRKRTQPAEDKVEHAYDTCPTSYERRPGKRGGRVTALVDGKKVIQRTPMEKLVERAKKHKQVVRKGHLFGQKHGCYFNPYTFNKVNEKTCIRIPRPAGFQIGRGGTRPLHELIGLRDDYDTFCDIRGVIRKACLKWRPQNIQLAPGKGITWKHYSSSARVKIYDYVYSHFPALFHFRDESGQDSWVVTSMAAAYLASNRAYTKVGAEAKRDNHLRRNASGPQQQRDDDDDGYGSESDVYDENGELVLPGPEKAPAGYDDDYDHNTQSQPARTSTTDASSSRRHKRTRSPSPQTTSRDKYDDETRPKKKGKGPSASRSSSPARQPTQPSGRDIRRADKAVANEADRDKELGASRNKAGSSKHVALAKAKEKPAARKEPVASLKPSDKDEGMDEESDDDEPIRTITKKVTGHQAPVKAKDGPAPDTSKKRKKPAGKGKNTKGDKEPTPEPESEGEEPAPKKRSYPKIRPVPPESEAEEDAGPSDLGSSSTGNPRPVGTVRIPVGPATRGQTRGQKK